MDWGSLMTDAVRPAADEPLPEVYTPIGDTSTMGLVKTITTTAQSKQRQPHLLDKLEEL